MTPSSFVLTFEYLSVTCVRRSCQFPIAATLSYMAVRSSQPGPFFVFEDGTPLTKTILGSEMPYVKQDSIPCIMQGIAFALGLLQLLLRLTWKTQRFNPWVAGLVLPFCRIFEHLDTGWLLILLEWHCIDIFVHMFTR